MAYKTKNTSKKKIIDYDYLRREYAKCALDKSRIYMIEHFLKTYDATRQREVQYLLFPRQKELCSTLGNAKDIVTTKPRQAGITTTCGAFIACEMCLANPESPQTVLTIGNTIDLAQQMLTKIKDFLLQFPLWMWGDEFTDLGLDITLPPPDTNVIFDVCNQKELKLKNGCKVVARSSGPDASRGVGGVTWLIFDEAAFIQDGADVYASALPTVSTGGHTIMISTPNGKDKLYYETCRRAALKGTDEWNGFELVKLKWFQDPRYNKFLEWARKGADGKVETIKEKYLDKYGNVKFDPERWEKLESDGYKASSPWYIDMCRKFNNDEQKIAQELDVSFLGSASNVVSPEYIEMQDTANVMEPVGKDPLEENTWIWKPPIPGHRYIMSIDNSRGDSADRTALEICDMDATDENGVPCVEQVLEYHGKKFGDEVGEMAYRYGTIYGNAHCVVDCIGGTGDACVLTLKRMGYPNLYYDDPTLKTYTAEKTPGMIKNDNSDRAPGFHSSSVREQMLSNFASMVRNNQIKLRSSRVIAELETWIYKGTAGRMDHMDGCHDDTITCLAMGMFVMRFSLDKMNEAKERDAAFLRAWVSSAKMMNTSSTNKRNTSITVEPKNVNPFVPHKFETNKRASYGDYMWLLSK